MNRRYLRHFSLFGKEGQDALLHSGILVIGAGGIGCSVLYNIAAAGIGKIGIIDPGRIFLPHLNRQILYDIKSINQMKVDIAKKKLEIFNPDCSIKVYKDKIQSLPSIIKEYEIVVDCCNNFDTSVFIDRKCYEFKKTLISATATGYFGCIKIVKTYLNSKYPCQSCFDAKEPKQQGISCEGVGVLGAVTNTIGSITATKTIQEILQFTQDDNFNFFYFDFKKNKFDAYRVLRNTCCKVCSK